MTVAEPSWAADLLDRVHPVAEPVAATPGQVVIPLFLAVAVVAVPPLWRLVRVGVTLVHELGHAGVGVLVGRRFTGFVLRGDMSGHAVTAGRPRGPGRVASVWAGYPAPALVGAGLAWAAGRGWSAPVLTAACLGLLLALVRVRSLLTLVVTGAVLLGLASLWWWREDTLQAAALLAVGVVLVVGAWRHLGALLGSSSRGSDPAVLASLTHVPALVWNASFAAACAGATWVVWRELAAVLGLAGA